MRKLLTLLLCLGAGAVFAGPPPGHPDTDQAARLLGLPEAAPSSFERGRILTALPSNAYVYLQLETAGGVVWIAGPRGDDAWRRGQRVAFGPGRLMRNWYSRKLQRSFDQVMFVAELQRLPEVL